jgi:Ser/Thr protein kinase RdoA (MazF antagonist)
MRTAVPTAHLAAVAHDLRATVQMRLEGALPESAGSVAGDAGRLLRDLHAGRGDGLPRVGHDDRLVQARARAELVTAIAPELAARVRGLVRALERRVPRESARCLAHGDFESGQLLVGRDGLVLLDLDDLCHAPAALDLANYAAHLVDGNGAGLSAAEHALACLVEGYGREPEALRWHLAAALLCRAPAPFRRYRPDWPHRVEGILAAAEEALG